MANIIKVKRKTSSGAPSLASLSEGEFCLVVPDAILYQRCNGALIQINNNPKITVGTTAPLNPSTGDIWIDTN